jgi:ABC-type multidrug transport system fused ATPase/permease subunit
MVLDQGNLVEFDTVPNLLAKPNGIFASMAAAAGLADSST